MGYEEVKARVSETRVIKKLRRKFRRLFLSAQVQRDTSLAFAERDAALDELEYLREKYVSLEAKTLEENLIKPNEVRFNFTLSPIFLNDRKLTAADGLVKKQARGRILWNGLDDQQAFYLEIECLRRVERNMVSLDGKIHFPILLSLDMDHRTFTMTNNGTPLDKLKKRVMVPDVKAQIDSIIQTLKKASVVHLDIADGKNITVNDEGTLSLIDFDIACLDGMPLSSKINSRYVDFIARGGYAGFYEELFRVVNNNDMLVMPE